VYLLFHTIHDVLRAEKILKGTDTSFELVPVPRNLSSDCGMCIRVNGAVDKTIAALDAMELVGIFLADGGPMRAHDR